VKRRRPGAALALISLVSCSGYVPFSAYPPSSDATAALTWPGAGDAFVYAGTLNQTLRAYGATSHTASTVTESVRTTATNVDGRAAIEYDGTDEETGSGAASRGSFLADVAEVPSKARRGADVTLLRLQTSNSDGVTTSTEFGPGNGVFDEVPEVPQAQWSDSASRTEWTDNQGVHIHDVYSENGSYDERERFSKGVKASLQTFADGNADYQWPSGIGTPNSNMSFSAPAKGLIQIEFTYGNGFPITQLATLRDWYATVPPVLASDVFEDHGRTPVPKSCATAKQYAGVATQLVEQETQLDIVFGEHETITRTAYVEPSDGLVCLVVHDVLTQRYDYAGLVFSYAPIQETVTDETLGLQRARLSTARAATATAAAMPLDARIDAWRAALRLEEARSIFHSLPHLRERG
jgi:hypothetical protein